MTTEGIAAIVTCRDLGRYLEDALNSIEQQTRPPAEVLVVDDGSEDIHTRQVLARVMREGTAVTSGEGRGAAAARNLGARLTTSGYILWLDADDVLEPRYFEEAAARLDADLCLDFVSCAMRAFGDASYVWTPAAATFVEAVATGAVPHASTMMRRSLWQRLGGFDETLPTFELLDFWAAALEGGARGAILEEPLLNYRVRPNSGYRRSIQSATYRARLAHFYLKHGDAVQRHGVDLVLAKEAFNEGQRAYRTVLAARATALEAELASTRAEVERATTALVARGRARVEFGDLTGTSPLSGRWGRDRGTPLDRYYIERFIASHHADIRGRVLEVREPMYAERFGGGRVSTCDVVDRDATNTRATIVADLRDAPAIADGTYDCIILTQVLQLVDDVPKLLLECARALKPGGSLLATAPTVIRVDDEAGRDGDYWRLTEASARKLFAGAFPVDAFEVTTFGNVKACAAFLYGVSVEEMNQDELDQVDPLFPLGVSIRAVKPRMAAPRASTPKRTGGVAVILAYHRIAELSPDAHALCTPPDVFRAHMAQVRERCSPIALDELIRAAASGQLPDRAVAVTLDDGYLDALTTASPILVEYGVPATFFVNSDRLDEQHERWWDILERVFLGEASLPPSLSIRIESQVVETPTSTPAERAVALDMLNAAAWPAGAAARRRLAAEVVAWSGAPSCPRASHRVLTADELRTLAERPGHTIGAHTVNHLALTRHDTAIRQSEIREDKAALERLLERSVDLFSYPYGDFDPPTIAAVRDAGFRAAVTVDPRAVAQGTSRFLLPRIEIVSADHGALDQRLDRLFTAPAATLTSAAS